MDPNVPVVDLRTVDEQIALSLQTERLVPSLSAVLGALATALAVIGLYGVIAYIVALRSVSACASVRCGTGIVDNPYVIALTSELLVIRPERA
jgi:hypothetical protein